MLVGNLDALMSNGIFDGWAYDDARPQTSLHIAVVDQDGAEVAEGLANLHRPDIAQAGYGAGWCGFRLRVEGSARALRKSAFQVWEKPTGAVFYQLNQPNYVEAADLSHDTIEAVVEADPTTLLAVEQLAGCGAIFERYIRAHGVKTFVRNAYVYVLQRPADPDGLNLYGRLLRQGMISPYAMIETLATSTEFRSRPRTLVAPSMAGFPFFGEA